MKDFAIFFHQNQLLKIRKFQDDFCNFLINNGIFCVPFSPLMIQIENLNEKSRISSAKILPLSEKDLLKEKYQKNEILSLKSEIEIDEIKKEGKIRIAKILKDSENSQEFNFDFFSARSGFFLDFEKISPMKICEIEIEETEKSTLWKILSEKWIKTK